MLDGKAKTSGREDLVLLETAAREAGALALTYFQNNPEVWLKPGDSPVTEADFAVDKFLANTLRSARPSYGWLSEESEDDAARLTSERLFVVDPIDGTRGFMEGSKDWTISVAIVQKQSAGNTTQGWRPKTAALYNPCRDEMYLAEIGQGSTLNGESMQVSGLSEISGSNISISKPMYRTMDLEGLGAARSRHIPSLAYRLALVASGALSAAVARPNSHDWDLAAADLLVQEAGGILLGENGSNVSYNAPVPKHGMLAAANETLGQALLARAR